MRHIERLKKVREQKAGGGVAADQCHFRFETNASAVNGKSKSTVYTVIDRMLALMALMALIALQTFVLVIWDV